MLKQLCIAALLSSTPLMGETVGNVQFEFPNSNEEWKVLFDAEDFTLDFEDDEDEEISEEKNETSLEIDVEKESSSDCQSKEMATFKVFTHREEGLEMLFVIDQIDITEEEDDSLDTLETIQQSLNDNLNCFFPNHQLQVTEYNETDEEAFAAWEFRDDKLDLIHGYSKAFSYHLGEKKYFSLLSYLSTAPKTEENKTLWTQTLQQAKIQK